MGEDASAYAQAVASEETQNALDRAGEEAFSNSESEAFSNSESEADSACSSIFGAWSDLDGDDASSSEPEDDDDLPVESGFTFQNLTTAAEWKTVNLRDTQVYSPGGKDPYDESRRTPGKRSWREGNWGR